MKGINAPVFQEVEIADLSVTGAIPADLRGIYIRNGPNPMFQPIAYAYPLEGDAGMLLALYETGLPHRITPNLDTLGEWDFQGDIEHSMTAHPRLDPQTGDLHFYRYSLFTEPYLIYYVANAQGTIVRSLPLELPRPSLFHNRR